MIEALAKAAEVGEKVKEAKSSFDPDKRVEKSNSFAARQNEGFDPDRRVEKGEPSVSKAEGFDPDKGVEKKDTADSQKSETPNDKPNGNLDSDKNTNKGDAEDSENKKTYPPNSTLEIDGKECKTDDNGEIYSIDGKLKPNCEYTLNGFKYKTDSKGRIINAQGDVKLPKSERDQNPDIKSKDKKPDDDKGHIIGHQIGGTETEGNLVPQNKVLNRGEYNKLEKQLAKLKAEGHDVKVEVTLKYKGDSDRPDSFRVKYTVDGKTYVKTFKNEAPQNGGNK